jgi:hypothetical protein
MFRALLIIIALACLIDPVYAQGCTGQPNANTVCAGPGSGGAGLPGWRPLVNADIPASFAIPIVVGGTDISGGTTGRIAVNNGGKYGEFSMTGDCTFSTPAITCTKTGGASFAPSATTDTTNATNIALGTLPNGRLGAGFVNAGAGLTGGALPGGGTVAADIATPAQFAAATANKVLAADKVFTAEVPITFSATPTFDFSTFINAAITLTANVTSITTANTKAGQAGLIRFIQDGTGGRTMPTTITNFKCAGGCNFSLSTAANAVDVISYSCVTASFCLAAIAKDFK